MYTANIVDAVPDARFLLEDIMDKLGICLKCVAKLERTVSCSILSVNSRGLSISGYPAPTRQIRKLNFGMGTDEVKDEIIILFFCIDLILVQKLIDLDEITGRV